MNPFVLLACVGMERYCAITDSASPKIVLHYPTLSSLCPRTITFYLASREKVDSSFRKTRQRDEEAWREQQRQPSEYLIALRKRLDRQRRELRPEKTEASTPVGK
jgi:hypothetical protein